MKRLICLFWSICLSQTLSMAQEFNLIYIQLDYEMDYGLVNQKLDVLIEDLSSNGFILFYANTLKIIQKDKSAAVDIGDLHHLISNNRVYNLQMTDIQNTLLLTLEKQHLCYLEHGRLVPNKQYTNFNFHCFVGNDFFNADYHNQVFGSLLATFDLPNNGEVNIYHYNAPLDDDGERESSQEVSLWQFNEIYSLNPINIFSK